MERTCSVKCELPHFALLVAVALLMVSLVTVTAVQPAGLMLVKIVLRSHTDLAKVEATGIPVYARLGSGGESYLLAGATPEGVEALRTQDLDVSVLDSDVRGASYYLVYGRGARQLPDVADQTQVLHFDGVQGVVRSTQAGARRLVEAGLEIAMLSLEPIALHPRSEPAIPDAIQPDPSVAAMIAQVDSAGLYQYEQWLTGEESVEIGGQPYTIVTRHTSSGTPIQKATQFAYEHLASLGLDVEYYQWAGVTHPNVIATQPGLIHPDDVYIICAHLDDMPAGALAPGADDNASGSTGVLVAADILSHYDFGCTLRFALWTGEEQGLLGSDAWAEWASEQGLNILGVLNMDMIAHDSDTLPIVDLHARSWLPDSVAMADLFADVVDAYDIDLEPHVLVDNSLGNYSDNKSFWDEGYTAILAIEDRDDFTPYYHTVDDKLSTLNMSYFAEFVKASVATFAHMSDCLLPEGAGALDGYVTVADGPLTEADSTPIAGANVSMDDDAGHTFLATTGSDGYYTRTLPAATYTVAASAPGYYPTTVTGVVVLSGTVRSQDLKLEPVPAVAPSIMVEPHSLEALLYPGGIVFQTLWLTNAGWTDLDFFLHELSGTLAGPDMNIPWLSETPTSGRLAPTEGVSIAVAFNAAGLEPGIYSGLLDVESLECLTHHTSVPVTLTVESHYWRVRLPLILRGE